MFLDQLLQPGPGDPGGVKAADDGPDAGAGDDRRPHSQFIQGLEKGYVAESFGSTGAQRHPDSFHGVFRTSGQVLGLSVFSPQRLF